MGVSRSTDECENADDTIKSHTQSRPVGKLYDGGDFVDSHGLNDRQKIAIDGQQPSDDIVH